MKPNFVHLNLHTEYSISDGIVRIDALFAQGKERGMAAIALTDQSNLFAMVKFYRKAVAAGIKPILGVDLWLENVSDGKKPYKLIGLAQNMVGYRNLLRLVSRSYIEGQQLGQPVLKRAWLQELNDGLIVLSGAQDGDVGEAILAGDMVRARELMNFWHQLLPNRYYLELQRVGRARENDYLGKVCDLAAELQLPLVATNAVRFLDREDFEAHEARVCIHSGYVLDDPQRPLNYSEQQYLRSSAEMEELFKDLPESLVNTVEIAQRCNVELNLDQILMPIFPVPEKISEDEYFAKQAWEGLARRRQWSHPTAEQPMAEVVPPADEEYRQRLEYEISVIQQMGFAGYFLIVADFVGWSKQNGIPVGPGRGSGAGSLVAYVLQITDIDPIEHGLLFERFLNPERVSLPDIDIDFCMDGRDRVIAYVAERHGRDRVSQIITYGTMAARAVVRDVGRVLGYPYGFVDKLAKLIPFTLGISLEQAIAAEELLRKRYRDEVEVKTLIDLARKLEGVVRNAGKHAGGVVIAPSALVDFMPLYCEAEGGSILTQLDKVDVEVMGLVKFDFLGLRTLTIINWTLESINRRLQAEQRTQLEITQIPLDDLATYQLLQSAETSAVFQLESRMSRDVIRRFRPDCFSDLVTLVAIIRPGVLQSGMLDDIINRKHGREKITYLHPKLEEILKPTYGVAIYQEQVMQMAQVLAGYSLGGADLLRRAMGKKKPEEMARQRSIFTHGAIQQGVEPALANTIFDYMEKFASYGFNKSHSAAYALIAYQTAWLKTHYPAEFMAAVLSSDLDKTEKIVPFLAECRKIGLQIVAPNINRSEYRFVVEDPAGSDELGEPVGNDPENQQAKRILYGLGAIKGVGEAAAEAILAARARGGAFKSLQDLVQRVEGGKVNKRVLEALIGAGALDSLNPHRAQQVAEVESVLKLAAQSERDCVSRQLSLFGDWLDEAAISLIDAPQVAEWSTAQRLQYEKEALGFYLTGHPIEQFTAELAQFTSAKIAELVPEVGKSIRIAGFVHSLRIVNTRNGGRLAIVTLEDGSGTIEVTIFGEGLTQYRNYLQENQLIVVEGEVVADQFSDSYRIRATGVMSLEQARIAYAKGLVVTVDAAQVDENFLPDFQARLTRYQGKLPVVIAYRNSKVQARLMLGSAWGVEPTSELLAELSKIAGVGAVVLSY